MSYKYLTLLFCFNIYYLQAQINTKINLKTIYTSKSNFRAIEILNDSTLWFANSAGKVGDISLTGETHFYNIDLPGGISNHFRAISSTKKYLYALSINSPARLYQFEKHNYNKLGKLVFVDTHPKAFYDAMLFVDNKDGIAMGDPTGKCLSIISTNNGGKTWKKTDCSLLPKSKKGEAAFAASNTNISSSGKKVWIATGGLTSRIFFSPNRGKSWQVFKTPFINGKSTTGIYTIDFYNGKRGIICGGDYTDKKAKLNNKAITNNGGKTWQIVANNNLPGYISCVQYVPNTKGKWVMAVSTEGIYLSVNSGITWSKLSDKGFYTIRFINKHTAFLGGQGKIAVLKF